ncbi:MAG: TetR/AcrR family transcriptional regulator [Actinomycetota bacterium]
MSATAAHAPAAAPTRGHKKKERTRRQLVASAIEVIAERGESFTASDVTERAGMSNGTFYNYFDDREALLDAVVPEVVGGFAESSDALVDVGDPALRFATITARALHRAARWPDDTRALLRLDAAQRLIADGAPTEYLRADLIRGTESGRFCADVDEVAADVVIGSILFAFRRMASEPVGDDYVLTIVTQLLRSLGLEPDESASVAHDAVAASAQLDVD